MEQSAIANNMYAIRNHFGYTQDDFAKLLGVSQTTISNWETSGHSVSDKNIKMIMSKLPVSRDDIVSETNGFANKVNVSFSPGIPGSHLAKAADMVSVPVLGRVHAGPAGDPDVFSEEPDRVEIPAYYLEIDPECYVLDYEGDCMSKDFGDSTSLVISPNSSFGNDSIVVVVIDDTDYVVRRMEQNAKGLMLKPNSWNPEYEVIFIPHGSEHKVDFKGRALGCFRRFD